jgi:hypothetical protein
MDLPFGVFLGILRRFLFFPNQEFIEEDPQLSKKFLFL